MRLFCIILWVGLVVGQNEGQVRLVQSGTTETEGVVEIYHDGAWGIVCDNGWGNLEARVVCRELGYGRSAAEGVVAAEDEFGSASASQAWLSSSDCIGVESRLGQCSNSEWDSSTTCSGAAGVRCLGEKLETGVQVPESGFEGDVALVGGEDETEGRVMVYHEGEWRSVCDAEWDSWDAMVVCRQLGLAASNANALRDGGSQFGTSEVAGFWTTNAGCTGLDNSFSDCEGVEENWGSSCSSANDVAAVQCLGQVVDWKDEDGPWDGAVRLKGGNSKTEGRVEIYHDGEWRMVCDDHWVQTNAEVVCRQLGYGTSEAKALTERSVYSGFTTAGFWLDDVQCTGSETRLYQCSSQPWGKHNCDPRVEAAGVRCGGEYHALGFWTIAGIVGGCIGFLVLLLILFCVCVAYRRAAGQEKQRSKSERAMAAGRQAALAKLNAKHDEEAPLSPSARPENATKASSHKPLSLDQSREAKHHASRKPSSKKRPAPSKSHHDHHHNALRAPIPVDDIPPHHHPHRSSSRDRPSSKDRRSSSKERPSSKDRPSSKEHRHSSSKGRSSSVDGHRSHHRSRSPSADHRTIEAHRRSSHNSTKRESSSSSHKHHSSSSSSHHREENPRSHSHGPRDPKSYKITADGVKPKKPHKELSRVPSRPKVKSAVGGKLAPPPPPVMEEDDDDDMHDIRHASRSHHHHHHKHRH